jgi:acetyl-CoA carboxylase biotin carboxylase subunit
MVAKFKRVLVANRGEIAVRVMRTLREMGISPCAVYSEADREALHVRGADAAMLIGPAPSRESYLVIEKIIGAAKAMRADAIHPGYGFLSENPNMVKACEAAGIVFIGPRAPAMEAMGEKTRARENMKKAGVPVVPGSAGPIADEAEAHAFAVSIGYPVMLKAAAGGGGKGMRKCERDEDFLSMWRGAQREATSAFGDGRVYIEKFLEKPRHVEIQVFADTFGTTIHLGERECSVQRRHQKVIEETPSPVLDPMMRAQMGEVACTAARAVGYVGAGTVEFLVDKHRKFYFLEMNTRLQVEHPVTEWVVGQDLVRWQVEVAQGGKLPFDKPLLQRGHAIEARIYAEDPAQNFMPSPGRLQTVRVPSGPGIRDDSGVYPGYTVPVHYDPMISKLSVWANTRDEAIAKLRRALSEYVVKGITTNIPYLKRVLAHAEFQSGDYDTGFLERAKADLLRPPSPELLPVATIAAALHVHARAERHAREAVFARGSGGSNPDSQWKRASRAGALRKPLA